MTYDLDEVERYQNELNKIRSRLFRYTQSKEDCSEEIEQLEMLAARVSYEMHEYIRAIEDLLNADCYGGIH